MTRLTPRSSALMDSYLLAQKSLETVRYGTSLRLSRCHTYSMLRNKGKRELDNSTRASVTKEMAKPRTSKSARIATQDLAAGRNSQRLAIAARLMKRPKKTI